MAPRPRRKQTKKPKKAMPVKAMARRVRKPAIARQLAIPFPKVRNVTLNYKYPGYTLTSGVTSGTVLQRFMLNSMFDFDFDNNLGNKQPLYYDQLFGADGPYQYYKVNAWKTTITVTNLSSQPLHVYYDQGALGSVTQADTQVEAQNRAGNIYRMITGAANARPQAIIKSFKTTKSFAPKGISSGSDFASLYTTNPIQQIIGTLLVGNLSVVDTASFNVVITVSQTFYATAYVQDGIQS